MERITLPSDLSKTHIRVLQTFRGGMKRKEVAGILFRSEKTIANHLNTIFKILNVKNTKEALKKASAMGLLSIFLAGCAGAPPCNPSDCLSVDTESFTCGFACGEWNERQQNYDFIVGQSTTMTRQDLESATTVYLYLKGLPNG